MDEERFEQAVYQHKDSVHGFATQMLRDRDEGLDVAQESLVRLWEHRSKIESTGARAWLMRTAHNLCIDRIRRRKTRAEVAEGDQVVSAQTTSEPGPLRLVASHEFGRHIDAALEELEALDKAVVLLREVQALPYQEIADTLNMPLGTVKARLHRSRERLRVILSRRDVNPSAIEERA